MEAKDKQVKTLLEQYRANIAKSEEILAFFSKQPITETSLPRRISREFDKVMSGHALEDRDVGLMSLVNDMRREYLNRMAVIEVTPDIYSFRDFVDETLRSKTYLGFSSEEKEKFWVLIAFVERRI